MNLRWTLPPSDTQRKTHREGERLFQNHRNDNKNKWPTNYYERNFLSTFHIGAQSEQSEPIQIGSHFDFIISINRRLFVFYCSCKDEHATLTASTTSTPTPNNSNEWFNERSRRRRGHKNRKEIRKAWLMMCTSHIWV